MIETQTTEILRSVGQGPTMPWIEKSPDYSCECDCVEGQEPMELLPGATAQRRSGWHLADSLSVTSGEMGRRYLKRGWIWGAGGEYLGTSGAQAMRQPGCGENSSYKI